ncbi:hypothetical protein WJX84_003652 [Apatococcus fuscideae]|uniref:SBP-type domain-containing protein n=1 Tax=Apatococcus fuscideae TaxID=2026836 RepID=A0AAW1S497_9CHLO
MVSCFAALLQQKDKPDVAQGDMRFAMDRLPQGDGSDIMLWDPHKLSAAPRGSYQAIAQEQLQELQEQYSPAAVHKAAPSHRPRLEKSPVSTPAGKAPKVRSSLAGSNGQKKKVPMNCQVEGCHKSLSTEKDYYRRYRICEEHLKLSSLLKDGEAQRFCQQCGKFHPLDDFDADKRSCRARLELHNNRRRKRDEGPASQAADTDGPIEEPASSTPMASSPSESADLDNGSLPKAQRSSRKRRSPRSSTDGPAQVERRIVSEGSEEPAPDSEQPQEVQKPDGTSHACAQSNGSLEAIASPDARAHLRQRGVSLPYHMERSPSMQALKPKPLHTPSQGIYRHLSSPPRNLVEGQAKEAMQSQGLRVQSLPAAPVSIPGWEARQSWNSTAVEASALGTYLSALSQGTNLMLEVQNFQQIQPAPSEPINALRLGPADSYPLPPHDATMNPSMMAYDSMRSTPREDTAGAMPLSFDMAQAALRAGLHLDNSQQLAVVGFPNVAHPAEVEPVSPHDHDSVHQQSAAEAQELGQTNQPGSQ